MSVLLVEFTSCKSQSEEEAGLVRPFTDYPTIFMTPASAEKFKSAYPLLNDFPKCRLAVSALCRTLFRQNAEITEVCFG
jgi:hypothetical protein